MLIVLAFVVIAGAIAAIGCAFVAGGEIARSTLRTVVGKSRYAIAEGCGRVDTRRLRAIGVLMLVFDAVFASTVIRTLLR